MLRRNDRVLPAELQRWLRAGYTLPTRRVYGRYAPAYTTAYAPAYTSYYSGGYSSYYAPAAYTTYYSGGWYPGYWADRVRTRLWGSPTGYVAAYPTTYAAAYAPSTCSSCQSGYVAAYAPVSACSSCSAARRHAALCVVCTAVQLMFDLHRRLRARSVPMRFVVRLQLV